MESIHTYNLSGSIVEDENGALKYPLPEVNEIEINLSQLKRNYETIKRLLQPKTKFMAILKGNAYGHGMLPISKELELWGCDALGVVRLNEAFALREAGIKIPVYQLAPIRPEQAPGIVQNQITAMADNAELLDALEKSCEEQNTVMNVHIKINTGLNRFGVDPENAVDFINRVHKNYTKVKVEGVYTHFQNPDYNPEFTREQIRRFQIVLNELEKENLRPPIVHAGGSAAILKYPEAHYDMVRCGVLLFGLEHTLGEKNFPEGIASAMTIKGRILKIRELHAGEFGGYGTAFIPDKNTTVAIIGLGYGDGISRGWKEALVGGKLVPIVSFFMDAIMVDITDVKNSVKTFDEAILIGNQGDSHISWGDACKALGTYEDEQVQYITGRVPKHYRYID